MATLFDAAFRQDLLTNALATMLGVIIGIPAALWLARIQERRQAHTSAERMLALLGRELDHNLAAIDNWRNSPTRYDDTATLVASRKDELWRAISDGGELQWLRDLDVLDSFSPVYLRVRSVREIATRHFDALRSLGEASRPARILLERLAQETGVAVSLIRAAAPIIGAPTKAP